MFYTTISKSEAEDLLQAIAVREIDLHKTEGEAWDYMNGALAHECIRERNRLQALKKKLRRFANNNVE